MIEEMRQKMWEALLRLDTEKAIQALLDCYGRQLLSKSLYRHMVNEGYIEAEPDEEEDNSCFS